MQASKPLSGKVALVTGATGAVGGAAAESLAAAGATVVILGRDPARTSAAAAEIASRAGGTVTALAADMGDPTSIRRAAAELSASHAEIHVLVNNAAVFHRERRTVGPGWEAMLGVNHLGPFLLTNLLRGPLEAGGGRVLNVSAPSTTKLDFDDLMGERSFSAFTAFGRSKLANLLFTAELARRWAGSGVAVHALHPGLIRSNLLGEAPWIFRILAPLVSSTPAKTGEGIAWLAADPEVGRSSGGFWHARKRKPLPMPAPAQDTAAAARLWAESERLMGL